MKGRVAGMKLFFTILFFCLFTGCANIDPRTEIYYDPNYGLNQGVPVNYTAIMQAKLTLDGKEISKQDDCNVKAIITDNGNSVSYSEGSVSLEFIETRLPPNSPKKLDKCYYSKQSVALLKIIKDGKKEISRKEFPGLYVLITDCGDSITYVEDSKHYKFIEDKLPKNIHEDWDKCYYTGDKMLGMYKSSKKDIYRLFFNDKEGHTRTYDFSHQFGMVRSTQKQYLIWYIDQSRQICAYSYLPTRNFICADLTKAYANVRKQQGKEIAKTLLLALIQAYTSVSETTYYGSSSSTYSGVYNDSFGTGTWSGYGTSEFNAYSRTYDYSYIGYRAADLLDTIFRGSASIDQIESAMKENGCKCP